MTDDTKLSNQALPDEGLFPIRTVSAVTGVNPVTLRAWERRYKLIVPKRTPKGHRLYTREQIDAIRRVVEFLDRGIAISQVKPLLERAEETGEPLPPPDGQGPADTWKPLLAEVVNAVGSYDGATLDRIYDDALSLYTADTVMDKLVLPALTTIDNHVRTESNGVTQQRFLSAYLRNRLGTRFHHLHKDNRGPAVVVGCIPAEHDETGALLLALAAAGAGHRTVYLGGDVPFEELPTVIDRARASALVLTASKKPRGKVFSEQLPDLVTQLQVPVFMGGNIAYTQEKQIGASGARSIGTLSSMSEIRSALRAIDQVLMP